jgi:hypothetical protein
MENLIKSKTQKPAKAESKGTKEFKSLEAILSAKQKKANDFIKKVKLSF